MTAIANPAAAWLLHLPLKEFSKRVQSDPKPSKSYRHQMCLLMQQSLVGRTEDLDQ